MKNLTICNTRKFVYLILFLSICSVNSAYAFPFILAEWQAKYVESNSDAAGCQLCHQEVMGGNGWNTYGWAIRDAVQNNNFEQAFMDVEPDNSDGDPTGATNIEEIDSNTQPGWTEGPANTITFKNLSTALDQSPPSLTTALDPEINPDIGITPDALDFGDVFIGDFSESNLTVSNTGTDNLNISSIAFCLDITSPDYSLPNSPGSLIIPADSSAEIKVRYTPQIRVLTAVV